MISRRAGPATRSARRSRGRTSSARGSPRTCSRPSPARPARGRHRLPRARHRRDRRPDRDHGRAPGRAGPTLVQIANFPKYAAQGEDKFPAYAAHMRRLHERMPERDAGRARGRRADLRRHRRRWHARARPGRARGAGAARHRDDRRRGARRGDLAGQGLARPARPASPKATRPTSSCWPRPAARPRRAARHPPGSSSAAASSASGGDARSRGSHGAVWHDDPSNVGGRGPSQPRAPRPPIRPAVVPTRS